MKATLEIPDEVYRLAKDRAASEHRPLGDLVADGLRLLLETPHTSPPQRRRMLAAPVIVSEGNVIPALSNDEMAELVYAAGESRV